MATMSLISELKRRNVLRVAAAYLALAWLVVQVLDTLAPLFGIGEDLSRLIVIILAIGFVVVVIVSWLFELTPGGFRREQDVDHASQEGRAASKRLDRIIIAILAVAVVYFAFDKFVLDPARDVEIATEAAEHARDAALTGAYGEHSIAVMPFADMSPEKNQEYFSDGIAEEIISLLSRIRNLRVIARSSAFAFKGQGLAVREIADRLDVRYIMEGSIRRAGDRLRITAAVIDARTETQLWSEKFDRVFDDIFAIQDEIASEIVDRLEMQIKGELPRVERVKPESYALYLQAKHQLTLQSASATAEADRLLDQAVSNDPLNTAAWLLYFELDRLKAYWGLSSTDEAVAHSREAVARVLEIDPGNSEALIAQRRLQQDAIDTWEGELEANSFALKLLPTDVAANSAAASSLSRLGQMGRAIGYFEYVLGKDPLCVLCLRGYMFTLMSLGRLDAAEQACRRYISLTGGSGTYTLGIIQLLQGETELALEAIESSETFSFVIAQGRALVYWTLDRKDDYAAALAELEGAVHDPQWEQYRARPEDFLASLYAWVGREDEAFRILDELIDPPRSWGPSRWNIDPLFAPLHDDPRWNALLEKEGIGPQAIEAFELEKKFPGPGLVPLD
jgi:TolB-like protein